MNPHEPKEKPQDEIPLQEDIPLQKDIPPYVSRLLFTDLLLRLGMGWIAIGLPFALMAHGLFYEIKLQPSLSHYYFAAPTIFPVRTLFVGGLFALGCFLILHQGFSKIESFLLTLLGACAVAVAIVPMIAPKECAIEVCGGPALASWPKAHATFAVLVFVAMALVVLFCSWKTFGELPEGRRKRYRRIYAFIAIAMFVWPVIVVYVIEYFWPVLRFGKFEWRVLAIEVAGVLLFGIYWLVKTHEIKETGADKKAAMGQLGRPPKDPLLKPLVRVATSFPSVAKLFPNDTEEPVAQPSQQAGQVP